MKQLTVISLGWGVQSWTLAAMSALGDLPPVDFAIHSDTTWERQSTYQFAKKWTPWLEERGVKVVTMNADGEMVDKWGGVQIPAYSESGNGRAQIYRQCTGAWKIKPMRRYLQSVRSDARVKLWLGITLDEFQRAKDSDVKYIQHAFPLLDKNMTRADCIYWLQSRGLEVPGKSACTFCPYHNSLAWSDMKRESGPDWEQAVQVDKAIRDKRPPYPLFVHPKRVPLEEAVVIPEDFGVVQLNMLDMLESDDDDAECDSGFCFL